jgi:hypothetical protein
MSQDNLTAKQLGKNGLSDMAVFLPAISGFYATFVGKQRNEPYVDPARFPAGLTDMEQMNWLDAQKSLFPYRWSLYSGGHANLDLTKQDWSEDMVRNRDPNTTLLGDSGGFQIAKGLWEGDWKAPTSAQVQANLVSLKGDELKAYQKRLDAAQTKREAVLKWLDGVADYAMTLDIPTWIVNTPEAGARVGIMSYNEAITATHYNNEYFMRHRRGVANGGAKILNVLQGASHAAADEWYELMKDYCDPAKYPDTHFNGWAMGGQNMCDVHLILKRLIALKYDGLLKEGVHDWMHFLGTSKLEWAVLLTVIQRNVRKYANPAFTISFDCASPFLATANGQVYYENAFPHDGKWSYKMKPGADDKRYATDTRSYRDAVVQDGIFPSFTDSPVSAMCQIRDICIYKPGVPKAGVTITEENFQDPELYDVLPDKNKNDKWGRTSWDSFSYALLMGHNVWMHLAAVQEANRRFDAGEFPGMMRSQATGDRFEDIVERIFAAPTRAESEAIIEQYDSYWTEIIGGRGRLGKKVRHVTDTIFNSLFVTEDDESEYEEPELDEQLLDILDDSKVA